MFAKKRKKIYEFIENKSRLQKRQVVKLLEKNFDISLMTAYRAYNDAQKYTLEEFVVHKNKLRRPHNAIDGQVKKDIVKSYLEFLDDRSEDISNGQLITHVMFYNERVKDRVFPDPVKHVSYQTVNSILNDHNLPSDLAKKKTLRKIAKENKQN